MERRLSALESDPNCSVPKSKISGLISRIAAMAKTPTIESDLSQVLDEFLEKLNECDKYLKNGILNMNFAEAALLVQSSADLYGKKVDLLWDIIFDYQKRILLSDDKNASKEQEIEKLEERKRKYKRKHKTNENDSRTSKLVSNYSFGNAEFFDYLNQNYEQNDLLEEWGKFHVATNLESSAFTEKTSNKNMLFLPNNSIYTDDNEYVGRYDQFHSVSQIEDFFFWENEPDYVTKTGTDSYCNTNDFLLEKSIHCDQPSNQIISKEIFVSSEKVSFDVAHDMLRRVSIADSLFNDDHLSSISECNDENNSSGNCDNETGEREDASHMSLDQVTGTIDKRNKSCSQDSAFYELEDVDEHSNVINTPLPQTAPVSKLAITNKQLCCGSSVIITRQPRVAKRKAVLNGDWEMLHEVVKKRKKLKKKVSEKVLRKLATGVTCNLRDFEKFCRCHYEPDENEGIVPPLSESEESDSDEEDSEPEDNFPAVVEEPEIEPPAASPPPATSPPPTLEAPPRSGPDPSPEELEAEEASRRSVREWRSFILPKLRQLDDRADFDIHEYGSRIIGPTKIGEERPFGEVVRGKGAVEVARFFIATLQLANTNNIEIVGAAPGRVANDTFRLKTVDKTRHHELLEEYQAPSEETFMERLERAKALNPKLPLHSTPAAPSVKKIKFTEFSRRKLF